MSQIISNFPIIDLVSAIVSRLVDEAMFSGAPSDSLIIEGEAATDINDFKTKLAEFFRAASALQAAPGSTVTPDEMNAAIAQAIEDLKVGAPALLDTLNEFAAALNDDPNFAVTIATALGNKVAKADVLNALTETVAGKVLDARQGKVLNDLISTLQTEKISSTTVDHLWSGSQAAYDAIVTKDSATIYFIV